VRTNLQSRFLAFDDVRPIPDPWGLGVTFHVRREGAAAVQRVLSEIQRRNPIARAVLNATARATLAASLRSGGDPEGAAKEALEREVGRFELADGDLEALGADSLAGVLARLAGWEGLTDPEGQPIPYSEAAARELLEASDWVDDGLPYGGRELGKALSAWILEESRAGEMYRRQVVEDAAGN
jgi:hypothetical protein